MSVQQDFYLERAAEARASAAAATLCNVRERWLLSETSWAAMAARSARGEKARSELLERKASERAASKSAAQA